MCDCKNIEFGTYKNTTVLEYPKWFKSKKKIRTANIDNCILKEIKFLVIKEKLDKISQDIKTAELDKDSEKSKKLIEEFSNLAKQLNEEKS